jgi:hypothetical protein
MHPFGFSEGKRRRQNASRRRVACERLSAAQRALEPACGRAP